MSGQRNLVLLQSARSYCPVCEDKGVVRLVSMLGIPAATATPCVHCSPDAAGLTAAVEVRPLTMRDDTKRTA